jgi:hypothetical protein
MVARIVLCRLKAGTTDDEVRALTAAFREAVVGAPGLLRFHLGIRIPEGAPLQPAPAAEGQPYDYAIVFEFETAAALRIFEHRPAHDAVRRRLAAMAETFSAANYEM